MACSSDSGARRSSGSPCGGWRASGGRRRHHHRTLEGRQTRLRKSIGSGASTRSGAGIGGHRLGHFAAPVTGDGAIGEREGTEQTVGDELAAQSGELLLDDEDPEGAGAQIRDDRSGACGLRLEEVLDEVLEGGERVVDRLLGAALHVELDGLVLTATGSTTGSMWGSTSWAKRGRANSAAVVARATSWEQQAWARGPGFLRCSNACRVPPVPLRGGAWSSVPGSAPSSWGLRERRTSIRGGRLHSYPYLESLNLRVSTLRQPGRKR